MKELSEARVKPKMSSNFQITFPQMDPPEQYSQCQEMKSWLIYVVNKSPFEIVNL